MFQHVMIAVDNSALADQAAVMGVELARAGGGKVTAVHVYAAALHDSAFRRMEEGLPAQYQEPLELQHQREVHDDLISKGLRLISESMLARPKALAEEKGVAVECLSLEGKNFAVLLAQAQKAAPDLVILGSKGLGSVERQLLGSVCSRFARQFGGNVLVVKKETSLEGMRLLVAIDGSPHSFAALELALELTEQWGGTITAVHVFDPQFHQVAFGSIAGVLSPEAAKVFRFEQQQRLHDEIIDRGLKKVGERHLQRAQAIAAQRGQEISTLLLSGRPYDEITGLVLQQRYDLVLVGRYGTHRCEASLLGAQAENILYLVPANVLIVGQINPAAQHVTFHGSPLIENGSQPTWTASALEQVGRIPAFVRHMAVKAVEEYAGQHHLKEITPEVLAEARAKMGI